MKFEEIPAVGDLSKSEGLAGGDDERKERMICEFTFKWTKLIHVARGSLDENSKR